MKNVDKGSHESLNTLRPRLDGCHFADNILVYMFLNERLWISNKISLKYVPLGSIDKKNIIGSDNGLPNGQQAIFWTNDGIVYWRCVTRPRWSYKHSKGIIQHSRVYISSDMLCNDYVSYRMVWQTISISRNVRTDLGLIVSSRVWPCTNCISWTTSGWADLPKIYMINIYREDCKENIWNVVLDKTESLHCKLLTTAYLVDLVKSQWIGHMKAIPYSIAMS